MREAPCTQERLLARAAELLARPGGFLEQAGQHYLLRIGSDRRRRPMMTLNEAAFEALTQYPGLKPNAGGGWKAVVPHAVVDRSPPPPPGRPGVIEGERAVADSNGRLVSRRVNLGESPVAWLARRKGPDGRPWLSKAEIAAAERLREDFERAGALGRLTMDWSGAPRVGGGQARPLDPAERARSAKARVRAALDAAGPQAAPLLQRICLLGSALTAAERELGLARRTGKMVLKAGLSRLTVYYGLG